MKKTSYLRFNPENREIELEGTEQFIKTYFDKIQQMLPQSSGKVQKEPEAPKKLPVNKAKVKTNATIEVPAFKKVVRIAGKKAAARKAKEISLIDKVVGLIQDSETGMTTDELKEKTSLTPKQIWAITSRAAKLKKIKTTKRGVYVPG
jgi:hypothetical protein